MKKIGLLSDTHGWLDARIMNFFEPCDEIWHAGDIGSVAVAEQLSAFRPLRAVYGNIDGYELRRMFPEFLSFDCEEVKILMTHIGGYPNRYDPRAATRLLAEKPNLFICGHSHILKIMFDWTRQMLCVNPGAAGQFGFHTVRTLLRFEIDAKNIQAMEVLEISRS
ncbi:MAG: metallophosphatase family protein [Prevotellaceae bacterium]|jgi:putative phosphoesterase|nr:metallophosphatase family protein [Prevotellaceae bacterium]